MSKSSTRKKRRPTPRRPHNALDASRCEHCGEERFVASVEQLQMLNYAYPLPGMFAFLRDLARTIGPAALIVSCVPCGCFQQVGTPHDHAIAA
jgi:hypothetical protein